MLPIKSMVDDGESSDKMGADMMSGEGESEGGWTQLCIYISPDGTIMYEMEPNSAPSENAKPAKTFPAAVQMAMDDFNTVSGKPAADEMQRGFDEGAGGGAF